MKQEKEKEQEKTAGKSPQESPRDAVKSLEECKARIAALEDELMECRKEMAALDEILHKGTISPHAAEPAPPEIVIPEHPPKVIEEDETDSDKYLESVQEQIHGIMQEELEKLEKDTTPLYGAARENMVCPLCGLRTGKAVDACPECGMKSEAAPETGGRRYPLSAEKFLYIFNDRMSWFVRAFDKAMYLADRRNDYEKAVELLQLVIQFMEENLDLLKSKHRDFRLALAYAYLGRCYFQINNLAGAIENYKKGILLKAGNSYNCEIGLTAIYRQFVRQIRESGQLLDSATHPYLSASEIQKLNSLGTGEIK